MTVWNIRTLLSLSVLMLLTTQTFAQSSAATLDYKIVEQWKIPNGGFGKTIVVKANPSEREMRALGDRLRQDTKGDRNAFIFIYDNEAAARDRLAAFTDKLSAPRLKHHDLHRVGQYFRNANTGFHELSITTKGLDGPRAGVAY